jgi:hypothetical protein
MELPLSRGRFHGRHDRFLALGRAGCGGRQALFPESLAGSWSSTPARDQRRRQPFLSEGRGGTEAGAETGSALPLSNLSIPEQHLEPDHRAIKRRVNASQGFRSFDGAWRTIQGYEVVHMIRKGQVRWLPKGDVVGQVLFVNETFGLKAA